MQEVQPGQLFSYTAPGHTENAQTELTASFEDLRKRQTKLYKSFDLLLNKINITDHKSWWLLLWLRP